MNPSTAPTVRYATFLARLPSPDERKRIRERAGISQSQLARDLGVSGQTIYTWRRQEQIDRGLVPGLSSVEREELAAAKRRIRELEAELEIHRRASELLAERSGPKGASRPSK